MTSFFPSDAIRSRLEWNATLNPGAAPQTTEESKYQRKVRIAAFESSTALSRYQTSIIATIGEPRNKRRMSDMVPQLCLNRSEGQHSGEASRVASRRR